MGLPVELRLVPKATPPPDTVRVTEMEMLEDRWRRACEAFLCACFRHRPHERLKALSDQVLAARDAMEDLE